MRQSLFLGLLSFLACSWTGSVCAQFQQPPDATLPADEDHGVYSVQWQDLGEADPERAIAFDNFTLDIATHVTLLSWSGIYAEPFPSEPSDTDFLVQVWPDDNGKPSLDQSVARFEFEGGSQAGVGGADLMITANPELGLSPPTLTTVGGGPAYDYEASVDFELAAGDYWLSIVADQRFDSLAPEVDPEWQWHLGKGPQDGFFASDPTWDPLDTPAFGIFQEQQDLAFSVKGTLVPEPASNGLFLIAWVAVCSCRRRRIRSIERERC